MSWSAVMCRMLQIQLINSQSKCRGEEFVDLCPVRVSSGSSKVDAQSIVLQNHSLFKSQDLLSPCSCFFL